MSFKVCADKVKVVDLINSGFTGGIVKKTGADLIIKRLWRKLGADEAIEGLLNGRRYRFEVERQYISQDLAGFSLQTQTGRH